MKKITLLILVYLIILKVISAQYIYPAAVYSVEMKNFELSNFDINDTILYLPLGESGLHILDISDFKDIHEVFVYTEYEKRSRKKVYGTAYCVEVIEDKAYLSYGALGLKILSVSDPTMPYVLGTYYRYQDVYCSKVYENYALLGYRGMGMEIVDLSNLDDINMVSRNNIRDFTVNNIQIVPPYVVISGGSRGLRTFKFSEPFTSFKQSEFPRSYLIDNDANKLLIKGATGYLANDIRGLSVLNVGIPLYPLEVQNIRTNGKAVDLLIDRNYLYVTCNGAIEIYDIKDPEKPDKIFEHIDKEKEFKSLKMNNNYLYVSFTDGKRKYGIAIFQVE